MKQCSGSTIFLTERTSMIVLSSTFVNMVCQTSLTNNNFYKTFFVISILIRRSSMLHYMTTCTSLHIVVVIRRFSTLWMRQPAHTTNLNSYSINNQSAFYHVILRAAAVLKRAKMHYFHFYLSFSNILCTQISRTVLLFTTCNFLTLCFASALWFTFSLQTWVVCSLFITNRYLIIFYSFFFLRLKFSALGTEPEFQLKTRNVLARVGH